MDEQKQNVINQTEQSEPPQAEEKKSVLESGEKVFTLILLVLGVAAFGLSLELWFRMSEPRIASAAALPLFVSFLWVILSLIAVIENIKLTSPLSGLSSWKEKLIKGLQYSLPLDVVVMLAAVAAYCASLLLGLSFYISTPVFLYATMCYLTKKEFLKNIIWTALIMLFIVVVFRMLFGVVFP